MKKLKVYSDDLGHKDGTPYMVKIPLKSFTQ